MTVTPIAITGHGGYKAIQPDAAMPKTALPRLADQPYLLLSLASLFWAGNVIASRLAVGEISPMLLTSLRWSGVLLLLPIMLRGRFGIDWPLLKARIGYIMVMGVLGFTAFNMFYYIAAHYTSAVNIGIIQGAIPGMVFVLAYAMHGTATRLGQIIGMMMTLLGVVVVVTGGDIVRLATLRFNLGDLLMLAASLSYAIYTVLLPDKPKVGAFSFFAGLAVAAFLSSLPLLAVEAGIGAFKSPSPTGWLTVVYCAVFPSVLAQLFFMRGVELIGPGRAGLFVNLVPVFAAIFAVLILDESFQGFHAVALFLVLGGLALAEVSRPA
jgi:drug/metabolite transporter (DMT)-like permease